jgi:hypothetical protein
MAQGGNVAQHGAFYRWAFGHLRSPSPATLNRPESEVGSTRFAWEGRCVVKEPTTMKTAQTTLTIEETDELILAACTPEDGAIEDCEVSQSQVLYFFQTGAVGIVNRVAGMVLITRV